MKTSRQNKSFARNENNMSAYFCKKFSSEEIGPIENAKQKYLSRISKSFSASIN